MAWLKRCFRAGKLVTELLSAERLTGWVTEQSDWDLSWPLTFFAFVGGGDPGGELIEWSEDTECLARRCLVFPGSLRDISFRTAWGLAVPVNKRNDMIYKQNRSKHIQSKTKDFVKLYPSQWIAQRFNKKFVFYCFLAVFLAFSLKQCLF